MNYLLALFLPPLSILIAGRPFVAVVTFLIWIPAIVLSGGLTHPIFILLAWILIYQSREDRRLAPAATDPAHPLRPLADRPPAPRPRLLGADRLKSRPLRAAPSCCASRTRPHPLPPRNEAAISRDLAWLGLAGPSRCCASPSTSRAMPPPSTASRRSASPIRAAAPAPTSAPRSRPRRRAPPPPSSTPAPVAAA